jgi:hypothetical protein
VADVGLITLEEWFATKVWFLEWGNGHRLVDMSLKIQPGGYLLILRAISAEGPQVAFYQSYSLDGIRKGLGEVSGRNSLKWRPDKFKLGEI